MSHSTNEPPSSVLYLKRCPDGEDVSRRIVIQDRQCFTFGRDPRSDVVLKWDGVSRAHAWLDVIPAAAHEGHTSWELVCNGSGNGSFVNGVRRSRAVLHHGDSIAFGHGHDVGEGESLEDEAFVYMFRFESEPPLSSAEKRLVQSAAPEARNCSEDTNLALRSMQIREAAPQAASPIHRRVLAARSAASENLEVMYAHGLARGCLLLSIFLTGPD